MSNELELTQAKINMALNNSLTNAAEIINKSYLEHLDRYELVNPSESDLDIDIARCGRFYKLTKLVMSSEENFLNKLTTIVNVVSSIGGSIATVLKSDGSRIDYYLGVISKNSRLDNSVDAKKRQADAAAFKGALQGNLAGTELEEMKAEDIEDFRKTVLSSKDSCYSAVSGIVALRDEEDKSAKSYVQGIENLVDSLKGQKYTIVMLADPVSASELRVIKQGYETLYTQLTTFAKSTVTLNENDTLSMSSATTKGFTEGISKGISMTQSKTTTKGKSSGGNISAGVSFIVTANVGYNFGVNSSTGDTSGKTNTTTRNISENQSKTETLSSAKTEGKSLQLSYENRSVKSLLDKIDSNLERLDQCESFGAFNCAAYIIADSRETALAAASSYNALMRGQKSYNQASHINSWFKPSDTEILGRYIGSLVHPKFVQNKEDGVLVSPASIISGGELAIQVGLPKKSVNGITVIPMAPFGRNVLEGSDETLELGALYHMGHKEGENGKEQKVRIDVESLSMHTFITGSTGKGKSTAIYSILNKLMKTNVKGKEEKIKFMVIEPAKGEYKNRFGYYDNVRVYGTNSKKTPLLRINPFSFPDDIHVLEHIDRLIEIFNVCWPMYAAMPAVLKDAVERAYIVSGWNLKTSECRYVNSKGEKMFPSFADVLRQINTVMDTSSYSSDSKGDYKGALCTRIKSLTNGLYGEIFVHNELSAEELFDQNIIVDLSRTGSSETKALIMGLLVMKLQEHRMSSAETVNSPLKHVTVLEEAHNILKRTSTEQSSEGANMLGKSVEMLANSIAEMRTYGEGFIIADQSPGLMDMSVIRNTNTKIILSLPDLEDRELVGRAASLNDDQIAELSRLKTFVAAVYQNNWLEPVLCSIDTNFGEIKEYVYKEVKENTDKINEYVKFLLLTPKEYPAKHIDKKYIDALVQGVYNLSIPAEAKAAFIKYTNATEKNEIRKLRQQIIYSIFNCETAFGLAKSKESDIHSWRKYIKDILDPSVAFLSELEKDKIVMVITREKADIDGQEELFDKLQKIM